MTWLSLIFIIMQNIFFQWNAGKRCKCNKFSNRIEYAQHWLRFIDICITWLQQIHLLFTRLVLFFSCLVCFICCHFSFCEWKIPMCFHWIKKKKQPCEMKNMKSLFEARTKEFYAEKIACYCSENRNVTHRKLDWNHSEWKCHKIKKN